MKTGVVVQVRMGSSRLPGKVLLEIAGKPLLQYLLERLERCQTVDNVVVATSTEGNDDLIVDFCRRYGIECFRGAPDDVAGRLVGVLDRYGWDALVRISGDSPLLDHRLVDRALWVFEEDNYDLVTNVWPRSYPYGQSVEVLGAKVFRRAYEKMSKKSDLEHVTRYFYRNEQRFEIYNFESKVNYAGICMSVDTKENFKSVEALIKRMDKSHWTYTVDELVGMMEPARP